MMPRCRSLVITLAVLLAAGGCASRTVDVAYPDTAANRALLAGIAPRRVVIGPVADRRPDPGRIGVTPEKGKPLVTAKPVMDIVRAALTVEVSKNGHAVVDAPGDVALGVDVQEFWLDSVGRSDATLYVGRVVIAIVVADGRTGEPLVTRRYVGIRRHRGPIDSETAWRETMDAALARTIHDVAMDRELARAVARPR